MLRKVCIRLSLSLHTSMEYFEKLKPKELAIVITEVEEANKPK